MPGLHHIPQPAQAAPGQEPARASRILFFFRNPDDPRVRRQGDLLTEAGWQVVAIGLPGARSSQPGLDMSGG